MSKRSVVLLVGVMVALVLGLQLLQAAERGRPLAAGERQRVIVKVCDWDGVVPEKALDGFTAPAGKWVDLQHQGYQVESYLVAPNAEGGKHGLYAVLRK